MKITDYAEDEFIRFMRKILAENKAPTDDVLDVLLEEFCEITGLQMAPTLSTIPKLTPADQQRM